MTERNRRELLELADAIGVFQEKAPMDSSCKEDLEQIFREANRAAKSVLAKNNDVEALKAKLCATCRRESLYTCQRNTMPSWTYDCALLRANSLH